jgi:hypothetical protein
MDIIFIHVRRLFQANMVGWGWGYEGKVSYSLLLEKEGQAQYS